MKIRLAIRGFKDGALLWASEVEVTEANLERLLPDLATQHGEAMARGDLGMIEIEFLDDPGPDRFFRLGVDPNGMVMPIKIL